MKNNLEFDNILKELPHGGNIYKVAKICKKVPFEIIDLSASTNPLITSREVLKKIQKVFKEISIFLNKYPDPECTQLKKIIAEKYKISEETILCGNGSTELIYLSTRALSPDRVLIVEPTFIEYERATRISGVKKISRIFDLKKEKILKKLKTALKKEKIQAVFLCNPNNPTGWVIEKNKILEIVEDYPDITFLIDEAFIEFCEKESLLREATFYPNLIVFRSFTKFFGLAGLRLGYLVSNEKLIERLKNYKEPWSVNMFAQTLGIFLLTDKDFIKKSLQFFKKEKQYVETALQKIKVKFFPSVANFYLLYLPKGLDLTKYLLKSGILVRNCYNFYGLNENYIRVSLKKRKENQKFLRVLKAWLKGLL